MKGFLRASSILFLTFFSLIAHAQSKKNISPELLIYSTIQPSYWNIYLFDHGKSKLLTNDSGLNYNPTFSPDGNWLIFTSEKTGTGHLYALDLKNPKAKPKRLTIGHQFEDAASFSPDGKTIFFVCTRDGTANIFKIPFVPRKEIDQSQAINLTKNSSGNFNPAVSPDGNWIAFSSNRDAPPFLITNPQPPENYLSTNIYVMNTDGTEVKKLTQDKNWEGSPAWSSDGKNIYFYAVKDSVPRIYKMTNQGENIKAVSPPNISALSPTITSQNRIAFSAKQKDKWIIASIKPDGSDYRIETDLKHNYWAPAYDFNTKRLVVYGESQQLRNVFYAEVPGGAYMNKPMGVGPFFVNKNSIQLTDQMIDIYALRGYFPNYLRKSKKVVSVKEFSKIVSSNLDGSEMREIYQVKSGGYMIGLTSTVDEKYLSTAIGMPFATKDIANIWKFNVDGNNQINLTDNSKSNNTFPRFTSDGKHIIFRSTREGSKNIYIMNSDGSNTKRLTFDNSVDTMPAVSPTGDKILFSSARNGENYRIYMLKLKADGSPDVLTKLTNGPGADVHPTFSPDGKWIAYASERGGLKDETPLNPIFSPQPYGDVYIMRLADKKIIPITDNKWEDSLPFWSKK